MEYAIFFAFIVLAVVLFFTIPWVMFLISHGTTKDYMIICGRTIPIRSKATDKRVFDYISKVKRVNSKSIKNLNLNVIDNLEVHFVDDIFVSAMQSPTERAYGLASKRFRLWEFNSVYIITISNNLCIKHNLPEQQVCNLFLHEYKHLNLMEQGKDPDCFHKDKEYWKNG